MPVRMIHTVSRAEPYVFQPAVMAALAVLAVALLLREGRWLEGRALMKKRPWQNWFLVAEAAVDAAFFLVAFGIFLLGSTLIGWEGMPSQLISEALGLLRGATNRKAAWYYWSARANMGLGNRIAALNDARTAVNMAPDEPAFRELLAQLNAGSRAYGQRGTQGGFGSYLCANPCLTLCLANMLCNCCCLGGRGGFYYC